MAKAAAVPLAPGVWRIPLIGDYVNGFMLRDEDDQVTLIDMGIGSSGPKVMAALRSIGSGPSDVTRLMLTHCHPDHAGGAAHVSRETGRSVDIHAADAEYVRTGTQPHPDPTSRAGRLFRKLPDPKTEKVTVGEELHDGQVVAFAGGIRVIHTPGHSPGHASYLHEDSGVLITGDAIFNVLGMRWPPKMLCSNYAMTQQTAHRLAELDYSVAAFTHGPEIRQNPREAIRRFLARHG
ncbi:MAG TPA: MBL fold metallo-hydrolase [Propionicimonas sp.]|nr:MBL fold metallo-hydrolase [Propionicimonas sp.]